MNSLNCFYSLLRSEFPSSFRIPFSFMHSFVVYRLLFAQILKVSFPIQLESTFVLLNSKIVCASDRLGNFKTKSVLPRESHASKVGRFAFAQSVPYLEFNNPANMEVCKVSAHIDPVCSNFAVC